jgi:hypothetical protein
LIEVASDDITPESFPKACPSADRMLIVTEVPVITPAIPARLKQGESLEFIVPESAAMLAPAFAACVIVPVK